MIEGAEITIYTSDGRNLSFELSETQLLAICKLLGIRIQGDLMNCYSDLTLKQFFKISGNPLRLKEQD